MIFVVVDVVVVYVRLFCYSSLLLYGRKVNLFELSRSMGVWRSGSYKVSPFSPKVGTLLRFYPKALTIETGQVIDDFIEFWQLSLSRVQRPHEAQDSVRFRFYW